MPGPQVQVVTNTQPGNFVLDGAYIDLITAQQVLPVGPATALVGVVGAFNWGPINIPTPVYAGPGTGAADLNNKFGGKTTLVKSGAQEVLSASKAGASNFLITRVDDGTSEEATISLLDTSGLSGGSHTVLEGTAVHTGDLPNGAAGLRADLQSGAMNTSPILQLTRYFPGIPAQVWNDVVAYETAGSGYDATVAKANALAALNGTAAGQIADPYFVWAAGASVTAPTTGTTYLATGGTNGDSGVDDATLIGTDDGPDSSGMYTMRKQLPAATLVLADFDTATDFGAVALFCQQELVLGVEMFAPNTTTESAVDTRASDNMSDQNLVLLLDQVETYDAYQGQDILVSPLGFAAGIIASLPAWQDPGNHPEDGLSTIITTDRLSLGSLGLGELGQREANHINWIGQTPNGVMGLYHGDTSSGVAISDTRMRNSLSVQIGAVLARYVSGMLQTTLPIAQADENDPRNQLIADLNTLLSPMLQPGQRQISNAQIVINDNNNTQLTMQRAFLIAGVNVTTLTGVKFAVGAVQVGNAVQIANSTLQPAA